MNAMSFPPAVPSTTRMTPGAFMRKCRLNAGVTFDSAVRALSPKTADRPRTRRDLHAMESDTPGDYGHLVRCLRDLQVFPFNYHVFLSLAAGTCSEALPTPEEMAEAATDAAATPAAALKVRRGGSDGSATVESEIYTGRGRFVHFTGYFGAHGPDLFAAAPDLLDAARAAQDVLAQVEDAPIVTEAKAKLAAAIAAAESPR